MSRPGQSQSAPLSTQPLLEGGCMPLQRHTWCQQSARSGPTAASADHCMDDHSGTGGTHVRPSARGGDTPPPVPCPIARAVSRAATGLGSEEPPWPCWQPSANQQPPSRAHQSGRPSSVRAACILGQMSQGNTFGSRQSWAVDNFVPTGDRAVGRRRASDVQVGHDAPDVT